MVTGQKIPAQDSVPPAVAANTPHNPGTPTPRADAAGARGNLFRFPVTLTGYVEIDGDLADEARNTVGIDLRDAMAASQAEPADLDSGGILTFTSFEIGLTGELSLHDAMVAALRRFAALPDAMIAYARAHGEGWEEVNAILARIDGEA